jgi:hypothetical protein
MRLGEINATTSRQSGLPVQRRTAPVPVVASRALVAPTPAAAPGEPRGYRQAAFLAHLIATKEQLPQTRERRRAEPGEAVAAYRAAAELTK